MTNAENSIRAASCADDYDPNSMPVAKAREFIARFLTPVAVIERANIRAGLGRVLAEDIISPLDVPSHDNSAMDGYAVRFADLKTDGEATLAVAGTAFAGVPFAGGVQPGACVRIMTGAVVPEGADTIVMQEHVKVADKKVTIGGGHRKNQNLRRAGEDLKTGQIALKRGTLLRPAEIGLIASLGIGEISVYRKLRVAFFSTGDELVSIGKPLGAGQIYDSNRYTIHGMLTELGCEVIDMGVVRDDPKLLEQAFQDAARCADVVITSGGVSVGEADFVKELLERMGEVVFWKIAM
ncbi:MAG TPA: molybdopterin molybdotransferase MoeA, partial [Burkholderiales bacterium]|nr:molybdopterin molybdotransferase MoeA [Burkholderiales bacterium]